jgi:archaellum biogenesis protein FlaJ (TadC family)
MNDSTVGYKPQTWEKVIVYLTGFLFIGVIAYLVIRNEPFADPNFVVMIRSVLSLIVAAFGATVPGMLKVDLKSKKGMLTRASGALGLFVITYLMTPKVLPS